jgi:hypothetical protein
MEKMQLPEVFKEFIKCLNLNKVKYLLIGGWAVGLHGHPRATKDIDFLISIEKSNLENLDKALKDFYAPPYNIGDFGEKGNIIRFGVSPIQIDVINEADGIDIEDCYLRKNNIVYENIEISLISKEDLIINKKSSGRQSDLADVEKLEYKIAKNKEIFIPNSINELRCEIIKQNFISNYKKELNKEEKDIQLQDNNSEYYEMNKKVLNETLELYNKALNKRSNENLIALHKAFNIENNFSEINNIHFCRFRNTRLQIYNSIEKLCKETIKNKFPQIKNIENKGEKI